MSILHKKSQTTPFVGYGVITDRISIGGSFKGFSTWVVLFSAIVMALVLLNTTLTRMYEDYYSGRADTNKKILALQVELENLKHKHSKEYNEIQDMLFSHQIMELQRRISDGIATIEEKAWLEFLKKKKQEYMDIRNKEQILRTHEMTDAKSK